MAEPRMKEFQFSYRFDGADWGISIHADDAQQAREKIKAVSWARYDGEVMARIPAVPGAGIFVRLATWWHNRHG